MALYENGILVSGANTLPQMTLAEYQALPVSERPTYWERTDLNYSNIPSNQVIYKNGSVEDALDSLANMLEWHYVGASTKGVAMTLPSNVTIHEIMIVGSTGDTYQTWPACEVIFPVSCKGEYRSITSRSSVMVAYYDSTGTKVTVDGISSIDIYKVYYR